MLHRIGERAYINLDKVRYLYINDSGTLTLNIGNRDVTVTKKYREATLDKLLKEKEEI